MSVRRQRDMTNEISELHQSNVMYRGYVEKLMRENTQMKEQLAEVLFTGYGTQGSEGLVGSVGSAAGGGNSNDELVGLVVGEGERKETWLASGNDAKEVKMAHELYRALQDCTQPCEHTQFLSVGLLNGRAHILPDGGGTRVELWLLRSGLMDAVRPIIAARAWRGCRLGDAA